MAIQFGWGFKFELLARFRCLLKWTFMVMFILF